MTTKPVMVRRNRLVKFVRSETISLIQIENENLKNGVPNSEYVRGVRDLLNRITETFDVEQQEIFE